MWGVSRTDAQRGVRRGVLARVYRRLGPSYPRAAILFVTQLALLNFVVYVQALRFFALERVLRPVLDDIARQAIDETQLYARGFPLRTRLLAALPAINVLTAVGVVGITGIGHDLDLSDLGLAALVSIAIASTGTLSLTLLLSDSVTAPIHALHAATERVGRGDFRVRVPVVTTDETGSLARSFNQMTAGLEQRERLREAFGAFVDPQLTERVLEEGTDLAGEEVEISLLFMDIRGFTSYSEQADAKDVVARLNDLYGQVVPVITRFGGHANKFIGDGLLAIFGAPDRLLDHADRAVGAGIEIARLVRQRYRGELRVGIGINSGRVVVGTIGGVGFEPAERLTTLNGFRDDHLNLQIRLARAIFARRSDSALQFALQS